MTIKKLLIVLFLTYTVSIMASESESSRSVPESRVLDENREQLTQKLETFFTWDMVQTVLKARKDSQIWARVNMLLKWRENIRILQITLNSTKLHFIDSRGNEWISATPKQRPELDVPPSDRELEVEFFLKCNNKRSIDVQKDPPPLFEYGFGEISVLAAMEERLFLFPIILLFPQYQHLNAESTSENFFRRNPNGLVITASGDSLKKGELLLKILQVKKSADVLTIHIQIVYDNPHNAFDSWRNFWGDVVFALFHESQSEDNKPIRIKPTTILPLLKGNGRYVIELTFPFSEKTLSQGDTLDFGVWAPLYLISSQVPLRFIPNSNVNKIHFETTEITEEHK